MRQQVPAQRLERMHNLAHMMALRLVQGTKDPATAVPHLRSLSPGAGAPTPSPCWLGRCYVTMQSCLPLMWKQCSAVFLSHNKRVS